MTDDFDVEAFIEAPLKKPPQPTMAVSGDDAVSSHTSHSHENGHGRSVDGDGDSVMVDARNGENGENGGYEGEGSERRESLKSSRSRDDEASEVRGKDRERSKDGDRDRDRRRSSRSDRDRERRKRSRSRDRHSSSRRRRSRSRSRRRSDRDRERDRHRRRSRSRRRSSSRDRDRKRDRDRRDRSRSRRDRSRDRYGRDRSPKRGEKSKKSRSPSPQLTQEERDRRTVFVMQLAARLRDSELIEFFERAGKVRDVRIVADRASRRSKGVGYVEFREVEAVEKALAMSGEKLLGVPIIVSLSEAEKNRLAEQAARAARQHEIPHNRLYVGSLQFHLTEDDLRQVFEPFGRLESVVINRDPETKQSNGFGFVQFVKPDDAKQALEHMNGYNLAGRQIRVGLVTEKSGTQVDLDDSDVAGFTLTQQSRVELMAKLAKSHGDVFAPQEKPSQPTVIATRNILLKNMFNPAEETEPNWQQEIELDVKEECENKYGKVMHIAVDVIDETEGHVYLKFDTTLSSQKAVTGLNGRWFSGRQIEATFIPDLKYNAKYPDATLL